MKTTMTVAFLSFSFAVGSVFVRSAQGQDEPLYTKTYRTPENFLHIATQDLKLEPKAPSAAVTPQLILEAAKVPFPEGASAFHQEKRSILIVTNTQTNMKLVDTFIDKYADQIKPRDGSEPIGENDDDDPASKAIAKKLNSIVIPRARLDSMSLKEAINWLRAETIKLDPEKTGVPITIAPSVAKKGSSITLDLRDVPAGETLRYITGLASVGFHVSASGVTVKPVAPKR